jgi:23S rRNA A1618 N6-methylase RlmF
MRVIGEVPHGLYKITLFQWNGKFIIKIESGLLEQVYKIEEWDIPEERLADLLNDTFMKAVSQRFGEMHRDINSVIESL